MPISSKNAVLNFLIQCAKTFAFRYTPFGRPTYPYTVEPAQLAILINEIDRLDCTNGSIVEIGVARGMTTRFIAEHLFRKRRADQLIYALDTFASFTKEDIAHEVANRGKARHQLIAFSYNDFDVWCRNFRSLPNVIPVRADCNSFNFSKLAPIKLAFLDVDLYRPTASALPRLYDALTPDGVILVDDVLDNQTYDGAYQAYMEFCVKMGIQPVVVGEKCGIIRKSAH